MDTPSAWRAQQIPPRHSRKGPWCFTRVHRIKDEHARSIRNERPQFETHSPTVENRHVCGQSRIILQPSRGMHTDAVVRKDNIANPDHYRTRNKPVVHLSLSAGLLAILPSIPKFPRPRLSHAYKSVHERRPRGQRKPSRDRTSESSEESQAVVLDPLPVS